MSSELLMRFLEENGKNGLDRSLQHGKLCSLCANVVKNQGMKSLWTQMTADMRRSAADALDMQNIEDNFTQTTLKKILELISQVELEKYFQIIGLSATQNNSQLIVDWTTIKGLKESLCKLETSTLTKIYMSVNTQTKTSPTTNRETLMNELLSFCFGTNKMTQNATKASTSVLENKEWTFVIIKTSLMLVIFLILHWAFQEYFFDPVFHPKSEMNLEEVVTKLCPQGVEGCSVNLRSDWKEALQKALQK